MKSCMAIAVISIISFGAAAQTQVGTSLKLYLNGAFFNSSYIGILPILPNRFHFEGFSPSIRFQKEESNFYHELELVDLAYSRKKTTDYTLTERGLGLRWETGLQLNAYVFQDNPMLSPGFRQLSSYEVELRIASILLRVGAGMRL